MKLMDVSFLLFIFLHSYLCLKSRVRLAAYWSSVFVSLLLLSLIPFHCCLHSPYLSFNNPVPVQPHLSHFVISSLSIHSMCQAHLNGPLTLKLSFHQPPPSAPPSFAFLLCLFVQFFSPIYLEFLVLFYPHRRGLWDQQVGWCYARTVHLSFELPR